ncbi:MAG: hypothetical protein Q4F72_02490 [Desulfovibrionaceae bacterium]|nr:hypothetical protein [Desulfovibrionaceae bacterium]
MDMSGGRIAASVERLSRAPVFRGRGWQLFIALMLMILGASLLTIVWVNIERMDINYAIKVEKSRLREKQELHDKLKVERDRLLSPYELRIKAQKYGMKQPVPGQIRRLDIGPDKAGSR